MQRTLAAALALALAATAQTAAGASPANTSSAGFREEQRCKVLSRERAALEKRLAARPDSALAEKQRGRVQAVDGEMAARRCAGAI